MVLRKLIGYLGVNFTSGSDICMGMFIFTIIYNGETLFTHMVKKKVITVLIVNCMLYSTWQLSPKYTDKKTTALICVESDKR